MLLMNTASCWLLIRPILTHGLVLKIPSQTKLDQICTHISLLQLLLQIDQGSNVNKEFTMVIYMVCPTSSWHPHSISQNWRRYWIFKNGICEAKAWKSLKTEPLGKLKLLPQIHQDSHLDKECSQGIYKPCIIIWVTCTI
jgi:hypothetical protein